MHLPQLLSRSPCFVLVQKYLCGFEEVCGSLTWKQPVASEMRPALSRVLMSRGVSNSECCVFYKCWLLVVSPGCQALWAHLHHGSGKLQCMWRSNPSVLTSSFYIILTKFWGPSCLCSFPVIICVMEGGRSSVGKWLGGLSVQDRCQWYKQARSGVLAVSIVLLAVRD